jgi:hypothetical protein
VRNLVIKVTNSPRPCYHIVYLFGDWKLRIESFRVPSKSSTEFYGVGALWRWLESCRPMPQIAMDDARPLQLLSLGGFVANY